MTPTTEQIKHILEGAPEDATHYLTLSDTYLDNKNEVINIALLAENENLRQRVEDLEQTIEVIESQRPHWAKGYTSDSVAAQTSHDALTDIWKLLGVENQTHTIAKLSRMVGELESQQSEDAECAVEWGFLEGFNEALPLKESEIKSAFESTNGSVNELELHKRHLAKLHANQYVNQLRKGVG